MRDDKTVMEMPAVAAVQLENLSTVNMADIWVLRIFYWRKDSKPRHQFIFVSGIFFHPKFSCEINNENDVRYGRSDANSNELNEINLESGCWCVRFER